MATPGNSLASFDKQALRELILRRALKRGEFVLASGKRSSYYLDCKQVTLHAQGALLVAQGIWSLLDPNRVDAVGGMSVGADPITAAVITWAALQGHELLGFLVRKEPKGHGTRRYLEGPVQPGQRCIILEDVITTGGSSLLAARRAQEFGLEVLGVVAIVDRQEGGREQIQQAGFPCQALLTVEELGVTLPDQES